MVPTRRTFAGFRDFQHWLRRRRSPCTALIALIVTTLGWRFGFFVTGSIGFEWAVIWLKLYQPPMTNKFLSVDEKEFIAASLAIASSTDQREAAPRIPWLKLFTYREVSGLMTAKFFTDAAWYFFGF